MVVNALVRSRLGYCNALCVKLPLKSVWKLPLVQNAAISLLTGVGCGDHILPVLAPENWLPICFWTQFRVLVLTFKVLYGLGPE